MILIMCDVLIKYEPVTTVTILGTLYKWMCYTYILKLLSNFIHKLLRAYMFLCIELFKGKISSQCTYQEVLNTKALKHMSVPEFIIS